MVLIRGNLPNFAEMGDQGGRGANAMTRFVAVIDATWSVSGGMIREAEGSQVSSIHTTKKYLRGPTDLRLRSSLELSSSRF